MASSSIFWWFNLQAKARLLSSYEEQGRKELLAGNRLRALPFLSVAYQQGRDSTALRFMLAQAMSPLDAERQTLKLNNDPFYAAYSPDGQSLLTLTSDYIARVWQAESGQLLFAINLESGMNGDFYDAAFSPDARTIAISAADNTVKLYDAIDG